jgi:hypothetical protein
VRRLCEQRVAMRRKIFLGHMCQLRRHSARSKIENQNFQNSKIEDREITKIKIGRLSKVQSAKKLQNLLIAGDP